MLRASVASVGPWVLVVGLAGDADPLPMLPVLLGGVERDGEALLGVGLGGARAPPVGDAFEGAAGGEAPTARLVGRRPLFRPEEGDEGGLVCWYPIAGGATTDSLLYLSFSSLLFPFLLSVRNGVPLLFSALSRSAPQNMDPKLKN